MIKKIIHLLKLSILKILWRLKNKHNFSTISRIFPFSIVRVGNYSYGRIEAFYFGGTNESLRIGNFVSIAANVKFILGGNHNTSTVLNYPHKSKLFRLENQATSKGPIIVEDDVWIATNSIILSGVKLSRGSVIAAGSVVTKSTEPYSVYGGNPAKLIKRRFSDYVISKLNQIDYSKFTTNFMLHHLIEFDTELNDQNIDVFIRTLEIDLNGKNKL